MACQFCRLEIPETLCQVCSYLEQGDSLELPPSCEQCGAPVTSRLFAKDLCHVCTALLEVVGQSKWFRLAHAGWVQENIRLANLKRELWR